MSDLSVTAASVRPIGDSITTITVQCGEALTEGELVYKKTSDNKYYKASNDIDDEKATIAGVVLTPTSANNDYVIVQTAGAFNPGATVVATTEYVVSATAGGIAPKADLASGNRYSRLGYADTTASITLHRLTTDVQVA